MDAYQIIMICIASVTLMLKLIEFYHNINRKYALRKPPRIAKCAVAS